MFLAIGDRKRLRIARTGVGLVQVSAAGRHASHQFLIRQDRYWRALQPDGGSGQDEKPARHIKVVAINLDAKRNDADKFLAQVPANFSVVFDVNANTAKKLAIKAMPTSLLVNPQGQVVWVHTGFRAEDAPLLERRIEQAMQSNKIDKSTKLIGE